MNFRHKWRTVFFTNTQKHFSSLSERRSLIIISHCGHLQRMRAESSSPLFCSSPSIMSLLPRRRRWFAHTFVSSLVTRCHTRVVPIKGQASIHPRTRKSNIHGLQLSNQINGKSRRWTRVIDKEKHIGGKSFLDFISHSSHKRLPV